MSFFTLCPRDKKYLDYNLGEIPLRVLYDDGVDFSPDFDTSLNRLNTGFRQFVRRSGSGDSFTVRVFIHRGDTLHLDGTKKVTKTQALASVTQYVEQREVEVDVDGVPAGTVTLEYPSGIPSMTSTTLPSIEEIVEIYDDVTITFLLDYFMRSGTPLYINSSIIGVSKDDLYVITENKSRKQSYKDSVVWDLTFTKYVEFKLSGYTTNSAGVTAAINAYKNKGKKNTKSKLTNAQKLAKCQNNWEKTLAYAKKKTVNNCVKYLQKLLKSGGFYKKDINGWYNHDTYLAVKAYQKKHANDYHLKATGMMDQQTFNCLIGKPNQVGKTQIIKGNLTGVTKSNGIVQVGVNTKDASKYATVKVGATSTTKDKTVNTGTDKSTVTVKSNATTKTSTNVINVNIKGGSNLKYATVKGSTSIKTNAKKTTKGKKVTKKK